MVTCATRNNIGKVNNISTSRKWFYSIKNTNKWTPLGKFEKKVVSINNY